MKDSLKVQATVVSNGFIDDYMAAANGEYLKEYLFVLRHQEEEITVSMIADALNHTEADVGRALAYWKRAGALTEAPAACRPELEVSAAACQAGAGLEVSAAARQAGAGLEVSAAACQPETEGNSPAVGSRPVYSPEQVSGLAGDEDFSQLLYIAQKYMNKVFTQRECEAFAYLYDGLSMPAELLEYVVEYCVQGGHFSIRYIETVALNWHEKGIATVEEAKAFASGFSKDLFAVMKAFGLGGRNPGDTERTMIERWFKSYGFTREMVLEACSRTLNATHVPSFKYADKILCGWRKDGARTLEDVKRLDEEHTKKSGEAGQKTSLARGKTGQNQFQNFPQRDIDYDALVLKQLKQQ